MQQSTFNLKQVKKVAANWAKEKAKKNQKALKEAMQSTFNLKQKKVAANAKQRKIKRLFCKHNDDGPFLNEEFPL
jgi:hypothetical protein